MDGKEAHEITTGSVCLAQVVVKVELTVFGRKKWIGEVNL